MIYLKFKGFSIRNHERGFAWGVEIISTNIASSVQVPEWRPDRGLIFLKSEEFFLKLQRMHSLPSAGPVSHVVVL